VDMPEVPEPQDAPEVEPAALTPAFFRNFHARWAVGDPPFTRSDRALSGGWIRLADPRVIDAVALAAITDAWVPAVFSRLSQPVPTPTVDLSVHFRRTLPLPDAGADDLYLSIFRAGVAADGFLVEDGEIWSERGELVAQSRQLAVMMGDADAG
jgi:acyl-CoA thioesterase